MNLGLGSGDDVSVVAANRARLREVLPGEPRWLRQVHGSRVVDAATVDGIVEADAAVTDQPGTVAVVMVADCMPVLLADERGRCVGVAHAGWRGLAAGILQATVRSMRERLGEPDARLIAYLGPAIGPDHFEVGGDVLQAMTVGSGGFGGGFRACRRGQVPRRPVRARPHGAGRSRGRCCLRGWRLHVLRPGALLQPSARPRHGPPCSPGLDRSPAHRLTRQASQTSREQADRTGGVTGLTMLGALWRIARLS